MKNVIVKLANTMNRMKKAVNNMFDSYEETIRELGGNGFYPQLFETHEMM